MATKSKKKTAGKAKLPPITEDRYAEGIAERVYLMFKERYPRLCELASLNRAETNAIKSFLSTKVGYRPPYGGTPVNLGDAVASAKPLDRIKTGLVGLDHVLGGGLVRGSVTLVSSPPGGGKTTLALSVERNVAKAKLDTLHVSCEQKVSYVAKHAKRLGGRFPARALIVAEKALSWEHKPDVLIIDTLNTWDAFEDGRPVGTSSSMIAGIHDFQTHARDNNIAVLVLCHETKAGDVMKSLVHHVGAYLRLWPVAGFEGKLCTVTCAEKNRFARTPMQGLLQMGPTGFSDVAGIIYEDRP